MSTTIITTAASVTKLIDNPPNIIAEAVLGAILSNTSIPSSLVADINYGFNSKVNSYYRYGADYYLHGVPFGTFVQDTSDDLAALLLAAINLDRIAANAFAFTADLILTSNMRTPDVNFMVQAYFQDAADWQLPPSTESAGFGGVPGGNFIWQNTVTQVPSGKVFGVPRGTAIFDGQVLHMELHEVDGDDTLILDIPQVFLHTSNVYNVIYRVGFNTFGSPQYYFWVYDPNLHRHPSLDFAANATNVSDFFPIVPIRLDNENIVDSASHVELTTSSTTMLRKIGIDLQKFSDDLTDPDDATALDDVDNGYLMFAVSLDSDEDIALRYLYEYFRNLYYADPILDQQDWIDNPNSDSEFALRPSSRNHLFIKDIGIDILILFNFITIEVKNGEITDTHAAYSATTVVATGAEIDADNSGLGDVNKVVITGTQTEGNPGIYYNDHVVIYRKQLTAGTFVELVIHGLQHTMLVDDRASHILRTPIDDDGAFFIPITRGVVQRFNGADESLIYYESLVFLAYAIDELKLAWYQEQAFIDAISFIVIVIAVVFQVPELGEIIAAGITAILTYVAEAYLIGLLMSAAFAFIVDLIGGDFALILAAIATAIALYYGNNNADILDLVSAEDLLKYATQLTEAVNQNIADDITELKRDIELFEEESEALQEEIDAAEELLDYGTTINLLDLDVAPVPTNFSETPTDFYNRSIHLTNPGVLALDMVSSYHDRALTLPDLT